MVVVEVRCVDAGGAQGVVLEVQRLGAVSLGDPSVADQHVSQTPVCEKGAGETIAGGSYVS
jgi:hypothetical protein